MFIRFIPETILLCNKLIVKQIELIRLLHHFQKMNYYS